MIVPFTLIPVNFSIAVYTPLESPWAKLDAYSSIRESMTPTGDMFPAIAVVNDVAVASPIIIVLFSLRVAPVIRSK
ncbi:hypothetical protein D6779_09265 [Candidatus Parcubacteria bacterium]|nr:MAG: hypothetical protein D6779_09265 [Candidatus Parcubacteria bacterium]